MLEPSKHMLFINSLCLRFFGIHFLSLSFRTREGIRFSLVLIPRDRRSNGSRIATPIRLLSCTWLNYPIKRKGISRMSWNDYIVLCFSRGPNSWRRAGQHMCLSLPLVGLLSMELCHFGGKSSSFPVPGQPQKALSVFQWWLNHQRNGKACGIDQG